MKIALCCLLLGSVLNSRCLLTNLINFDHIRSGDVVLAINNVPVSGLSFYQAAQLLRSCKSKVQLTVINPTVLDKKPDEADTGAELEMLSNITDGDTNSDEVSAIVEQDIQRAECVIFTLSQFRFSERFSTRAPEHLKLFAPLGLR